MTKYILGCFLFFSISLNAQEKNLKLVRITTRDSSISFSGGRSTSVFITVPQDRYWRVDNIFYNTYNGSNTGALYINGKNLWRPGGGFQAFTAGPIWCVPGDVLDLFSLSSSGTGGTFDYRLAIFEFILE
jgi:hypothetical protein